MFNVFFVLVSVMNLRRGLSQLGLELFGEVLGQLVHDSLDGLVCEGLALVLKDEVDRIGLLAGGQVLALVHVKEGYGLEELLLCLVGYLLNLGKLNSLVQQKREVAAYGGILGISR